MVPGPRLPALALAWVLAPGLLGCPAEQLGVELPRGGVEAISPEDLRRDADLLAGAPGAAAAAEALAVRLGQMRVLPAFGSAWVQAGPGGPLVCGRKEGEAPTALLVVARGDPGEVGGQVAWAGLVSVAKAWDRPGRPPRTLLLCAVVDDAGLAALVATPPQPLDSVADAWVLGPLHAPGVEGPPVALGPRTARTWAAATPAPEALGAVDHRVVAAELAALVPRLQADRSPAP